MSQSSNERHCDRRRCKYRDSYNLAPYSGNDIVNNALSCYLKGPLGRDELVGCVP